VRVDRPGHHDDHGPGAARRITWHGATSSALSMSRSALHARRAHQPVVTTTTSETSVHESSCRDLDVDAQQSGLHQVYGLALGQLLADVHEGDAEALSAMYAPRWCPALPGRR
jgi:hypothetical protein